MLLSFTLHLNYCLFACISLAKNFELRIFLIALFLSSYSLDLFNSRLLSFIYQFENFLTYPWVLRLVFFSGIFLPMSALDDVFTSSKLISSLVFQLSSNRFAISSCARRILTVSCLFCHACFDLLQFL